MVAPVRSMKLPFEFRSPRAAIGWLAAPAIALIVSGTLNAGCSHHVPPAVTEAGPVERVASIYLIGDAGYAKPGDLVLQALTKDLGAAPKDRAVVFLGDNVYPKGLPVEGPERPLMESRLDAQLAVARDTKTRTIFVPGNHDWEKAGRDGWARVKQAEEFIALKGKSPEGEILASQEPTGGCPGPEMLDIGQSIRLVFLDTQWWLHKASYPKPREPGSACPADTPDEVVAGLARVLQEAATAGRHVIVTAHHPLETAGPHGGRFPFLTHLFPLRDVKKFLWIPLPVIGSLYEVIRSAGVSPQDLANSANRRMRERLTSAMEKHPPLLFAGGHEHSLQVFSGPAARFSAVSGTGSFDHLTSVGRKTGTLYSKSVSGYMRVDLGRNGVVRLAVIEVTAAGASEARSFELHQTGGR